MILRTPRLLLRPATLADADDWHDLDLQPGVLRFIRTRPRTPEESLAALRRCIAVGRLHHDMGFFTALEDGEFVGWFHLRPGPEGDVFNPELGYRLRPEAWGRGLATEGSGALVDAAFTELGASSVYAETMTVNTPSRRVMERLGMSLESSFEMATDDPVPGADQGEVRYRLRLDDWLAARIDPRQALHRMQAEALRARDGGRLDVLRGIGMALAAAEQPLDQSAVRAADSLVRELAARYGVTV